MYKKNEYVVYKKDVCKIKDIKHSDVTNKDYYILIPVYDESLKINLPVENEKLFLRSVISCDKADSIIDNMKNIEPIENITDKNIELIYKSLLNNGSHEDLIKIIKTTYLRNEARINDKRKASDKDSRYFNLAEKYLYNELAIALNMSFEETKEYIINKMNKKVN